jgi:hypothetical protein
MNTKTSLYCYWILLLAAIGIAGCGNKLVPLRGKVRVCLLTICFCLAVSCGTRLCNGQTDCSIGIDRAIPCGLSTNFCLFCQKQQFFDKISRRIFPCYLQNAENHVTIDTVAGTSLAVSPTKENQSCQTLLFQHRQWGGGGGSVSP